MRASFSVACLCALLASGYALASDEQSPMDTVELAPGSDLPTSIHTNQDDVHICFLVSPKGESLQFIPKDSSSGRFELHDPVTPHDCEITIKNVQEDDNGVWELYYTKDGEKRGSQFYNVTVVQQLLEEDVTFRSVEKEDGAEEEFTTITLNSIRYGARIGSNITITLSNKNYNEDCYLHTPLGDIVSLTNSSTTGVTSYPESTNFVSCRVVIGPMDATLLGNWTLCGKGIVGKSEQERCQPGVISWAINNPSQNWASTIHPNLGRVVHYGLTQTPLVKGTGTVTSCHIITPENEDIAVTEESDYPGLERVVYGDKTICSVRVSVANAEFIGNWILYGTYNSTVIGFNVVTQPMTLFLYDEDDPYSQAYNVTNLDTETHVLMEGDTITVVVFGSGTKNGCQFITNLGKKYNESSGAGLQGVIFVNDNNTDCRLQVGPVTTDMYGEWRLIGKFVTNNLEHNELQLPFRILEEDPANPLPDDIERAIEYLTPEDVYTRFGVSHNFSTATRSRVVADSCHILTPDNLQFILRSGLVRPGFETLTASNISCGVQVHVNNSNAIGNWMLIARLRINGAPIERRLPFTIHVEEVVNAVPSNVTVAEGNSLHVRLEKPTSLNDTCVLKGPARNVVDRDENFVDTCGFIVREVTMADAGTWEIEYGIGKLYRALIGVTVTARFDPPKNSTLTWTKGKPLNDTIGPEDTVFCRIEDPSGLTVFQEFGRCRIELDQARPEHAGVWKMTIGTAGRVLTETLKFVVIVNETDPKAKVVTSVVGEKSSVMITCQVPTEDEVTACKFRDPSGKVLLASQGVGEDRYSFHGQEISLRSEVSNRVCGLRITNPVVEQLGLWRCVVVTKTETYYGFLTVLWPLAMEDPEVAAAVVTVPTLTSPAAVTKAVEGNAVIMRCSVQSAIRYCYFRAQNGTVYTVSPGTSDWFEYAGEGLDAGDCSIRFPSLQPEDSGWWSCHVGFYQQSQPEQRAEIELEIDPPMFADQYLMADSSNTLVICSQVHSQQKLEYCRFVDIDGQGFTSDDVPAPYKDYSNLAAGKCELRIPNPSILERHPWTIVAKIVGNTAELTRNTQNASTLPEEGQEDIEPEPGHSTTEPEQSTTEPAPTGTPSAFNCDNGTDFMTFWCCVLLVSLILFTVGFLLGPKGTLIWTYQRTILVRDSTSGSMLTLQDVVQHNTQRTPPVGANPQAENVLRNDTRY